MSRDRFPNVNSLWSHTIARTLKNRGLKYAVVCPGSRSAPLAFAFAETAGIEAISILDERSAGFFALGLAKRERCPVALVCTSGTAAANFLPAIVEASESGVPMIVITADRPPELRACGAGQTIDQTKLYGGYVKAYRELTLPEGGLGLLRYLRQATSTAFDQSVECKAGPVHLNVPFRDPLPPIEDASFKSPLDGEGLDELVGERTTENFAESVLDLSTFCGGDEGLILVGGANLPVSGKWIDQVASAAESCRWPVLADALAPMRSREKKFSNLIACYDVILRNEETAKALAPKRVLVIGELPTSKTLRQWLAKAEPEILFLSPSLANLDPTHSRSRTQSFDFEYGTLRCGQRTDSSYGEQWREREVASRLFLESSLLIEDKLFEGRAALELMKKLPPGAALFCSNSMPPRDLEWFGLPSNQGIDVYCNRGANGIDGILSSAMGVAHRSAPTVLLTGDLALLHDSNGGLLAKRFSGSLTIVLINNDGGGIFEMLPAAQFEPVFEEFFATPQSIDFEKWAALYEIEYKRIGSWTSFATEIESAGRPGVRLLEIRTDRKLDSAWRKALLSKASGA